MKFAACWALDLQRAPVRLLPATMAATLGLGANMLPSFLYQAPHVASTVAAVVPSAAEDTMALRAKKLMAKPVLASKIEMHSAEFYQACTIGGILSCGTQNPGPVARAQRAPPRKAPARRPACCGWARPRRRGAQAAQATHRRPLPPAWRRVRANEPPDLALNTRFARPLLCRVSPARAEAPSD